jgi:hypothetical protein
MLQKANRIEQNKKEKSRLFQFKSKYGSALPNCEIWPAYGDKTLATPNTGFGRHGSTFAAGTCRHRGSQVLNANGRSKTGQGRRNR